MKKIIPQYIIIRLPNTRDKFNMLKVAGKKDTLYTEEQRGGCWQTSLQKHCKLEDSEMITLSC